MSEEQPRITVLLVDDEENILKSLQRLLMDEDFDIETATSGEAALEKLPKLQNVGLIVSDQRMPGMNGAEFLGRSREVAPFALRILLTGYSDINATIEAINKGGACRYLSKPWDDDALLATVRDSITIYQEENGKRRLNGIIQEQNKELEEWNDNLKKRLLQSAATIREQSQVLKTQNDKGPAVIIHSVFDGFFEVIGDRNSLHARTVSTLVTDVARKMNMDANELAHLRLAALLHDAGKIGSISGTHSKHLDEMSESESIDYRQHPLRSVEIFSKVEELSSILPLLRAHHESFDGSGFPDGLAGEAIPLGARLIAIADYIEKAANSVNQHKADYALMSARYRAGSLLDPQLVTKFSSITSIVYFEGKKTGCVTEVEVGPMELMPGMTISRDVENSGGVLLIQRGTVLDLAGVALIRSQYRKSFISHGVYVQISED